MTSWLLYAGLVSLLLGGAAWLLEQGLSARGWATRFPWAGALAAGVLIPLLGRPRSVVVEITSGAPVPSTGPAPLAGGALPPAAVPWMDVAIFVGWAALSAICLLAVASTLLAVARARRNWVPDRAGRHDVLVSKAFGPALVGLARPAIVLPRWARDLGLESSAVMAEHEHEHRRARDHVLLLGGAMAVALIPWNPVAWWMLRRLRGAVEMDCDRRTLASGVSLEAYGSTLLEVSRNSPGRIWNLAPGLIEPRSQLERRLTMMGRGRRQLKKPALAALLGGAVVLVAVACETPAPTDLQDAYSRVANIRSDGEGPNYIIDGISSSGDTVFIMGRTLTYTGDDPLIFIDGRLLGPGQTGETKIQLSSLRPEDIERVEVLKDAAAEKVAGPRAARAGAIFIYLKDGVVVDGLDLTGPVVVSSAEGTEAGDLRFGAAVAAERTERARGELERAREMEFGRERGADGGNLEIDELRVRELQARVKEEAAALERLERSGEASAAEMEERQARLLQEQRQAEELVVRLRRSEAYRAASGSAEAARESAETSLRRAEALMEEAAALVSRADGQPGAQSAEYQERLAALQSAIRTQAEAARGEESRVQEALRRAGEMLQELAERLKERPGGSE